MRSCCRLSFALAFVVVWASIAASGPSAQARDRIRIVGSSTVYPFSSFVAQEFGRRTPFPVPVVEQTGSGGGHKEFGAGYGQDTPDIVNSSRSMKVSEFLRARSNDVEDITEAVIGYDGIAFAQNIANDPIDLKLEELALAVVAEVPRDGKLVENPYDRWSDINPALPDREILIYGPPATSGTRDAFEELVLEAATQKIPGYGGPYTQVRQDNRYIPSGENDNLIVQKLGAEPDAFGIFGFSFLEENSDKLQGASIDGVVPRPEAISTGEYPISRSMYFYIKNQHIGTIPGLREYVEMFMSDAMIGPEGELRKIGLIPLPQEMREASRERVLDGVELKLKLTSLQDYMKGHE